MKIAVSVNFINNGARVSEYFGKSEYFFIYDLEKEVMAKKFRNFIRNSHGSEVFCAQMLIKQGVSRVICGTCENDAKKLFAEANIKVTENVDANPAEYIEELYGLYRENKTIENFQYSL